MHKADIISRKADIILLISPISPDVLSRQPFIMRQNFIHNRLR